MLILHGGQPDWEIQRWDTTALGVRFRLNAVALSGNPQGLGENRKLIQLGGIPPALYPLGVDPLMLGTALGGVRIL